MKILSAPPEPPTTEVECPNCGTKFLHESGDGYFTQAGGPYAEGAVEKFGFWDSLSGHLPTTYHEIYYYYCNCPACEAKPMFYKWVGTEKNLPLHFWSYGD